MKLNLDDPLDRLYLETVPCRPSPSNGTHLGPTRQYELLLEQAEWLAEDINDGKTAA